MLMSSHKTLEGATPGFPERQVPEGPSRAGTKEESGGVSKVEGETGDGSCCTQRCIAGFQARHRLLRSRGSRSL